jgi:hypothetical protein
MKIYANQTNITLSLITGTDLTDVDVALIKYKRPDNTIGSWTGSVNGQLVEYTFVSGDIPSAGDYYVWVHITFLNTKVSIGEPSLLKIYTEGE